MTQFLDVSVLQRSDSLTQMYYKVSYNDVERNNVCTCRVSDTHSVAMRLWLNLASDTDMSSYTLSEIINVHISQDTCHHTLCLKSSMYTSVNTNVIIHFA